MQCAQPEDVIELGSEVMAQVRGPACADLMPIDEQLDNILQLAELLHEGSFCGGQGCQQGLG